MQSSFVSPAQLLLNYLDGEHRKIGQDISANQFSQELNAQQGQLVSPLVPSALNSLTGDNSNGNTIASAAAAAQRLSEATQNGRSPSVEAGRASIRATQALTQSTENQSDKGGDVFFTNGPLLEKAAAQWKLPAEARKAIKAAEDCRGRISLKALNQILSDYQPVSGASPEGQVPSQDVQSLLGSMQSGNFESIASGTAVTGARQQGSYSLTEFRRLVENIARQSPSAESKSGNSLAAGSQKLSGAVTSSTSSAGKTSSAAATASTPVECRPSTIIPSFVEDDPTGTRRGQTATDEVEPQKAVNSKETDRQAAQTARRSELTGNASNRQSVNAASTVEATQIAGSGKPQDETAGPSQKGSPTPSLSTRSNSQPANGVDSTTAATTFMAAQAATVQSASPAAVVVVPQAVVQSDPQGPPSRQAAASGIGADNATGNKATGERRVSTNSASTEAGTASGSTPPDTSIRPAQQTGESNLQNGANQGEYRPQSASPQMASLSAAADTDSFLWTVASTGQNAVSASASDRQVKASAIADSSLIREQIAKNGTVRGEIQIGEANNGLRSGTRVADSTLMEGSSIVAAAADTDSFLLTLSSTRQNAVPVSASDGQVKESAFADSSLIREQMAKNGTVAGETQPLDAHNELPSGPTVSDSALKEGSSIATAAADTDSFLLALSSTRQNAVPVSASDGQVKESAFADSSLIREQMPKNGSLTGETQPGKANNELWSSPTVAASTLMEGSSIATAAADTDSFLLTVSSTRQNAVPVSPSDRQVKESAFADSSVIREQTAKNGTVAGETQPGEANNELWSGPTVSNSALKEGSSITTAAADTDSFLWTVSSTRQNAVPVSPSERQVNESAFADSSVIREQTAKNGTVTIETQLLDAHNDLPSGPTVSDSALKEGSSVAAGLRSYGYYALQSNGRKPAGHARESLAVSGTSPGIASASAQNAGADPTGTVSYNELQASSYDASQTIDTASFYSTSDGSTLSSFSSNMSEEDSASIQEVSTRAVTEGRSMESRHDAVQSRKEVTQTGAHNESGPISNGLDFSTGQSQDALAGAGSLKNTATTVTTLRTPTQESLNLNSTSWTSELAERIQSMYQQKRTSNLTLDLEPEGMGHLTLRVSTKKQEVAAYVSADNVQVGDLLSRNSTVLREHLQSQGLTLTNLSVDVRQGTDGNAGNLFQNGSSRGQETRAAGARRGESNPRASSRSVHMAASSNYIINLVA